MFGSPKSKRLVVSKTVSVLSTCGVVRNFQERSIHFSASRFSLQSAGKNRSGLKPQTACDLLAVIETAGILKTR
jgi:hypothetical protein